MPIDVPPLPRPAIVESVGSYEPFDLLPPLEISPDLYPDGGIEKGCPSPTIRIISIVNGQVLCRLDPSNTAATSPVEDENGDSLDKLVAGLTWANELIDRHRQAYPEVLRGTGTVKIITLDPETKVAVQSGWGQVVSLGGVHYIATVGHVMEDDTYMYLILNDSGFVARSGNNIFRVKAQESEFTTDKTINLLEISDDELDRFLSNGGDPLKFGEFDLTQPLFILNTVSAYSSLYPERYLDLIVGIRDDATIIYGLRNFQGSNLCIGISGTPLVQFREDKHGNVIPVIVAFVSYTSPDDIGNTTFNSVSRKQCAPFSIGLRTPSNIEKRGIRHSEARRIWHMRTKNRTFNSSGRMGFSGMR